MNFASDNSTEVAPEIFNAIASVNSGTSLAYGNDEVTKALERRMSEVFEREVATFLVATGTAANALAIAHYCQPWNAVFCHEAAHLMTDEAGAPEFFGGGLKLVGMPGENGKIVPETLGDWIGRGRGVPHSVIPAVVSLSQSTEFGTVYRNEEVRALAGIAHARGLKVHMDGARLANAIASNNGSLADATWKAGVDVLSFGATKNGALAAEAVIFFDPAHAVGMASRRKRGGQLFSKHRFFAAQFDAYLKDGLWLRLARRANDAAAKLGRELAAAGLPPVWPVEANEIFIQLPPAADQRLRAAGATYVSWPQELLPRGTTALTQHKLIRLVASFATKDSEIDRFIALARGT
jgi:threonine aldolase